MIDHVGAAQAQVSGLLFGAGSPDPAPLVELEIRDELPDRGVVRLVSVRADERDLDLRIGHLHRDAVRVPLEVLEQRRHERRVPQVDSQAGLPLP
jgi:hypothetical protein